jgi:hypothetical protein
MNPHHRDSGNQEWYTPAPIVEAARQVMGAIDLDPASSPEANRTVRAARFYTVEDDGLSHPWAGRVWLNHPYGGAAGYNDRWIAHLIAEYQAGRVSQAVAITWASTDTAWFARLMNYPICYTYGRPKFTRPVGAVASSPAKNAPPKGAAITYLGPQVARFAEVFEGIGRVMIAFNRVEALVGVVQWHLQS